MAQSPTKPRGARATKTETVSVRLDPKLRYMAELAARKQRRSLSSYIEWAVAESLSNVNVYEGTGYNGDESITLEAVSNALWDIDDSERFVRLAIQYPELMDMDEQERWKMLTDSMWLEPAKQRDHNGHLRWNQARLDDVVFPVLRLHWSSLVEAHGKGASAMREWVVNMRASVSDGSVYPLKLLAPEKSDMDDSIPF